YRQLGGLTATVDGSVIFASIGDRLAAFDAGAGHVVWRFDEALANSAGLAASPRGDLLVAANGDGVAIFDARTGRPGPRFGNGAAEGIIWKDGGLLDKLTGTEESAVSWTPHPRFSPGGDVVALQDS